MDRSIHQRNLARYADLLELALDPTTRARLQARMIREEDRYGSLKEKLDQVDALIRRRRGLIDNQDRLIAQLMMEDLDTYDARMVLTRMMDLLRLLESYRKRVAEALTESHPSRVDDRRYGELASSTSRLQPLAPSPHLNIIDAHPKGSR